MKNNTKKTLKIYLKAALKYKLAGFFIVVSVIIGSGVSIISALYLAEFFNGLALGDVSPTAVQSLMHLLVIFSAFEVVGWFAWRGATFITTYFQTHILADLSEQAFKYLHKHSFSFFNNNFVGSLVKRVKWFSRAFEVVADQITWHLLPLVVNISLIIIILFSRSYLLGLGLSVWLVLFLTINLLFTKYKIKYDIAKAKKETETTGVLADTITNNKAVKLFNGYQGEVKRFGKVVNELRVMQRFAWNLDNFFEAVQGVLMVTLMVGILFLSLKLWQKGILQVGDFVLIQFYLFRIFRHVWDFGKVLRRMYQALADAEEMTEILNTPHEITDIPSAKKLKVDRGEVIFENVDFYYHQTRKVLDKFSLSIKSKERLALIGPSGAGKTTIVTTLLRMRDVDAGKVLIDKQNIAKVTQESLRGAISLVPQSPILFHRTIMDNIRYGRLGATNSEVMEAAKKAYCHDFIIGLSSGYNTFVGERGIKLSGGERQRVAIARAILRDTPILVLDEATSSLDSESERLIQKAMEQLMKNKTVIAIAHRLSTIRKMDRIVVIDKGKIVEQGSHAELISKARGKYKKLWDIQAGSFVE